MTHIFLSYSREDQFRARMIAEALQADGFDVWWDSNLRAGESYDEVTEKHLREAGAVVVLWSKRSSNSKWVRAEATVGERFSKLVPAMIDQCERPLRFELVQTADLINWQGDRADANWRGFINAVRAAIGHQDPAPARSAASPQQGGAAAAGDITIENTFWTSIKDGTERADFEAYLKRYPHGHFADLARNRLAALERPAAPKPAPRPSQPAAAAPAPPRTPPRPAPQPAARAPASAPASGPASGPAPARANAGPAKAKSGPGGIIAIVALVAVVAGGGVFAAMKFLGGGANAPAGEIALADPNPAEPGPTPEPAADDAAPVALATGTAEGDTTEDALSEPVHDEDTVIEDPPAEDVELALEIPAETPASTPTPAVADGALRDCDMCPEMVALPAGAFLMGSPADEPGRAGYEGPQHEVSVGAFALARTEVTHAQWQACVDDGGCRAYTPGDAGFGREQRPAIFISWQDAKAYAQWLSAKTGKPYRLPSEAEWEYAARGGTATAYWWGGAFDRSKVAVGETAPVDSLAGNPFGLKGMLGNAAEWVEDCYVNNYAEAPVNGDPVLSGDCGRRVVRGGSWRDDAQSLRVANRSRITQSVRDRAIGFRVARDLD